MTIPLQTLIDAMPSKPDGWYASVTSAGKVHQDILHIDALTWARLSAYQGQWGDVVSTVTKAVGINPCGGCKRRGKAMNRGGTLV